MIELRHHDPRTLDLGYAGDTFNTAVYLRRSLDALTTTAEVAYLTGIGDDAYSTAMRAAWRDHGITDAAITVPGHVPGLYTVRTDETGERSFTYWRGESAARQLFTGTDWLDRLEADVLYLSGITLQLLSPAARAALLTHLDRTRQRRRWLVFDTNYRPAGWPNPGAAADAMRALIARSDIVLATLDDETALHGPHTADRALHRIRALGPGEVVVKTGADGVRLTDGENLRHVPATPVEHVRDTTAAGDSFAGAYLAGRLSGTSPADAAALGNHVAAQVVATPGAITPHGITLGEPPPG